MSCKYKLITVNGNCIGFNGKCNGVYWYVMDSIGEMLNPIGQVPKTHHKNEFCNGFISGGRSTQIEYLSKSTNMYDKYYSSKSTAFSILLE